MSSSPTWQTQVSFTDRLESVIELTSAHRLAFPGCEPDECHQHAKTLEERIYFNAESLKNYHASCRQLLHELNSKTPFVASSHPNTTAHEDKEKYGTDSGVGNDIGDYKNAVFCYDGLFSTIYKAVSKSSAVVALKVCNVSSSNPPHDSKREARILHDAAHSCIISLLDTFAQAGSNFVLVFPYVPYDLDQALRQDLLSIKQVRSHLRDLFRGLDHIHTLEIIHRDIKPSNILLRTPDGPAFLADFGIAWSPRDMASEPANQKITDVGTTCYRAPELLFGNTAYDQSLDLWAAGCVVAEACRLNNQSLFDAGDVGSEFALIRSIFELLGTPNMETWPEAATFPDWGKMEFHAFPPKPWTVILPTLPDDARDLVSKMVQYESSRRLTAQHALEHSFLVNSS